MNTLASNKHTFRMGVSIPAHSEEVRVAPRLKGVTLQVADRSVRISRDQALTIANALADAVEVSEAANREAETNE